MPNISIMGINVDFLRRALRSFQTKESIIGKLFAKHIKLEEAKQFLERARCVYTSSLIS